LSSLVAELVKKAEEKTSVAGEAGVKARKRASYGFKIKVIADFPDLALEVDCRYEKMTSKSITEKVEVIAMVDGKRVNYRYMVFCNNCNKTVLTKTNKAWVDDALNIYDKKQVKFYQKVNGEIIEVEPLERTKELKIEKLIPAPSLEDFLIEKEYEVWSENARGLWKLADYLIKNDKIAVARHSFGNTFVENYALLYPIVRDGKFVLVMALTKMKKEFKHFTPIPNGEEIAKRKPISVLPEI